MIAHSTQNTEADTLDSLQLMRELQVRSRPALPLLADASAGALADASAGASLQLRLDHGLRAAAAASMRAGPALAPGPTQSGVTPAGGNRSLFQETSPMPARPPAPLAPSAPDEPLALMLLEVRINRQEPGETALLLQDRNGKFLASAADILRWRLPAPQDAPVVRDGVAYHRLDALGGSSHRLDLASQRLDIDLDAGQLARTNLGNPSETMPLPTPSPAGGFINYDLTVAGDAGARQIAGLVEVAAFGAWGHGTTAFLANQLQGLPRRVVRLESTITRDSPETLDSVRLGDTIGGAGSWSRAVRLGGVQRASNFAVQPGFITFPLPSMSGVAGLPSTVDYYVNDALRFRREVPSGPFSIQELPVLTGQGEARLVVRDVLGREQVVTQPFYASTQVLRQGLQAFSYEAGLLRNDFGISSNAYGPLAAIGTHRVGVTDRLTAEMHGEILRRQQTFGVAAAFLQPNAGVLSTALAASRSASGSGALGSLGFTRQAGPINFGLSSQRASAGFAQLGYTAASPPPRQVSTAFASLATLRAGVFGLSYTAQRLRDQPDVRLLSANFSRQLGSVGALGVALLRIKGAQGGTIISANLTMPFDGGRSASVSKTFQPGFSGSTVQLQQNAPVGSGFGYRFQADSAAGGRQQATVTMQTDIGAGALEAVHADHRISTRTSISGGMAFIGGAVFPARRIDNSFAVVDVPGYPEVRVFAENQLVATTDRNGRAMVPNLRAYETNHLRIDGADLPMDVSIDSVLIDAVPYARSGLLLRFPVRRSDGGVIRVLLDDGEVLPSGAVAQLAGRADLMPAGQHGEIYLTGLSADNQVSISWQGRRCQVSVPFVPGADPLPALGTFLCKGVTR